MGEVSRTKKVLALSAGSAFNRIVLIVSGMVAARLLTKHDYATMKQTLLVYGFLSPILMLGLSNALYYFLPKEKERKKGLIFDNIVLLLVMGFLFSLFLFFGGYRIVSHYFENPDLERTLRWMVPYPLYVMPAAVLGAVLLVQNKTYVLTVYNVFSNLFMVCLTIAAIVVTRNYTGPLMVQIYFPLLLLPVVLWLSFRYVPGDFTPPRTDSMLRMLKYSVPLGLASMMGTIMLQTDKIIVSAMSTPEEFANYVNGAVEIPLVGVITGSIASVILVDMMKYIDEGNKERALVLFRKAAVKSATVLFPVMIFLLISGKAFILTLYSEKYLESVLPFYIYLFVLPVRIVVYGSALMALGESKTIMIRSFFDLVINVFLSIILVKWLGYIGAAVATVLTLYLWTVPFNLYKIGQGFGVRALQTLPVYETGRVMFFSLCAGLPALPYVLTTHHPWSVQLVVSAMLYFPAAGLLLYRYGLLDIPEKYERFVPAILRKGT